MAWQEIAIEATLMLIPIVGLALTILLGYAAAFVQQKAEGIKWEVGQASFLAALAEAERVGVDAIAATQQTLVADLKAAADPTISWGQCCSM